MIIQTVAGVLLAANLMSAPSAGSICHQLDLEPTVSGVADLAIGLLAQGYAPDDAARVLVNAVQGSCPEYIPLLLKFADRYGG